MAIMCYNLKGILLLFLSMNFITEAAVFSRQREAFRYRQEDWENSESSYVMSEIKVFNKNDKQIINSTLTERKSLDDADPRQPSLHFAASNLEPSKHIRREHESMEHLKNLTLSVKVKGVEYILELTINKFLFASNYTEKIISDYGEHLVDDDMYASHCFYVGKVLGWNNSVAAVSTCNGIRGYFIIEERMIYIEPDLERDETCLSCRHKLFQTNSTSRAFSGLKCGIGEKSESVHRKKRAAILEWPQDLDGTTRVVELYVVNDNYQYLALGSNSASVLQRMRDTVNMASVIYHSQDIYLVLVGAEVWDTVQKVPVYLADSGKTLDGFNEYSKQFITTHHDDALFITSQGPFDGEEGVIGLAYVGGMCTDESTFFICDIDPRLATAADTTAHELGHTFGLRHNTDSAGACPCDDPLDVCVMDATTGAFPATKWSSCSKTKLKSATNRFLFSCLLDFPATLFDASAASLCGNGLVETGEECDCGDAPLTECNPECCSNTTCKLIAPAECAHGRCCDVTSCKLQSKYSVCRAAEGECDLSEYCSGTDNICPSNVYRADFSSCTVLGAASYCYQGSCGTKDSQCERVWGSGITASNEVCYTESNPIGDQFGNCGFADPGNYTEYVSCDTANVLCGLLHCKAGGTIQIEGFLFDNREDYADESACWTVIYPVDTNLPGGTPSFVPNGSPCGTNMACVNQKCEAVSSLTAANTCGTCAGNGVCNTLDQCHCNEGFAPPDCTLLGEGGSLHSNPISPLTTTSSTTETTTYSTTTTETTTTTTTEQTTSTTTELVSSSTTTTTVPASSSTQSTSVGAVSSTVTAVTTESSTNGSTCTQKINCGFGGDLLVYLCIGIGGFALLTFCCCACYICLGSTRTTGVVAPMVYSRAVPVVRTVVSPVIVERQVQYARPIYVDRPVMVRRPVLVRSSFQPALRYTAGYGGCQI